MVELTSALTFALILPMFQLAVFGLVLYHGIRFYHSLSFTVMTVLEHVSDALIDERTTYHKIREILERLEKKL